MKIPVLRRALMATAIATSLVSGTMIAAPAQAQFGGIVYDPSNYAQNVLTAARTLQQINNQIQQIQNQATSLINEARNLASLLTAAQALHHWRKDLLNGTPRRLDDH